MPLLEKAAGSVLSAVGLGGFRQPGVRPSVAFQPDFEGGFQIVEVVQGREMTADAVTLVGSFMPLVPFEFGGTQRIVKDYYAGSSEPTVQVLGPSESDTTIKGRFKTKRFKDTNLKAAAQEYQELVDAIRLRGNLVKITLGEWRRYGFIEEAKFRLFRLTDIEYDIKFSIVGFNAPSGCRFTQNADDDLIRPNKELTNAAAAFLSTYSSIPEEMPRTLVEFFNDQLDGISSAVGLVTDFVTGIVDDVDSAVKGANRALGLIRNARAELSRLSRAVGSIQLTVENLGKDVTGDSFKQAATVKNAQYVQNNLSGMAGLLALLAALRVRFASLINSTPLRRHLVKSGDSLQRLAVQYYNSADSWQAIYDHNKLQSADLIVGAVLEIPRI
jgi:hypothetical protein